MPNEWISVKERLPTEEEYTTLWSDGDKTLSRILIAFMTDTVEYEIGCYDGYKWMNEWCTKTISDVIAWRIFIPYTPTKECATMPKCQHIENDPKTLDPCIYEEIEVHKNVTVRVNKCKNCGHIEYRWERQPDTISEYEEGNNDNT